MERSHVSLLGDFETLDRETDYRDLHDMGCFMIYKITTDFFTVQVSF
jgi:hypothetical protein